MCGDRHGIAMGECGGEHRCRDNDGMYNPGDIIKWYSWDGWGHPL